jgi:phosphatidylinositol alpha-1,6-mannosyltransferase
LKTLLVTSVFPPKKGGSGRWFWEIYRRQPREQVVIAAGEDRYQDEFDRTHSLQVVRLPLAFPTWGVCSPTGLRCYWRAYRTILRLVRTHEINCIHCGTLLPEGLLGRLCCTRLGVPYLCYVHGEELNIGQRSRELGWLMRRVLAGAQTIIANSENTARLLQTEWRLPPQRVSVLHPGTDTRLFVPALPDPAVRSRLGWTDRRVILTVGRLQRRKGHDQLIAALDRIRQAVPNVLYAIVGDGEQRPQLEAMVQQKKLKSHVQFLGELDDSELLPCYQQCDLFVLPNRKIGGDIEGFGLVLVEAQSCGKPVIAGMSGGTAETMQPGITGLTVDCESTTELAEVVAPLLQDSTRRAQMGRDAREWAVHQFDWEMLARRASELFGSARIRKLSVAADQRHLTVH